MAPVEEGFQELVPTRPANVSGVRCNVALKIVVETILILQH